MSKSANRGELSLTVSFQKIVFLILVERSTASCALPSHMTHDEVNSGIIVEEV